VLADQSFQSPHTRIEGECDAGRALRRPGFDHFSPPFVNHAHQKSQVKSMIICSAQRNRWPLPGQMRPGLLWRSAAITCCDRRLPGWPPTQGTRRHLAADLIDVAVHPPATAGARSFCSCPRTGTASGTGYTSSIRMGPRRPAGLTSPHPGHGTTVAAATRAFRQPRSPIKTCGQATKGERQQKPYSRQHQADSPTQKTIT